ncbi:MAG TPA: relaxase [Pantoea ananatis]|nr:relaxase [Pantoea ananatis]
MRKIRRGKNFAGVVQYAFKSGVHHKSDPVVIGGNMLSDTALDLIAEFDGSKHLRPDIQKAVWHNSLRLPDGESLLNEQWVNIADDYMNRMGFSETHLRCYVIHDDEAGQHIHIIASRVDLIGGKLYLGRNENLISTQVIQELEIAHELTKTKGPSPSHSPPPSSKRKRLSRSEEQKEKREGQQSPKTFLQNTIDTLLSTHNDIQSFVEALAEKGITTIPNISSTGRMNGFSFEYAGIAFKASQLGKAYSWATLQEKLRYAPERDTPLLFAIKASARETYETSEPETQVTLGEPALSSPAALEVEAEAVTHSQVNEQGTEAQTLLNITLMPSEQTRSADFFMTRVLRWLLSIPYLATFTDLLKKAGKTFLHQKSSFSTIHTVLSAEPELYEPLGSGETLTERTAVPFR